jgi:transposase-like protein
MAFKKALIEASLNAELSHHLGYVSGAGKPDQANTKSLTKHRTRDPGAPPPS